MGLVRTRGTHNYGHRLEYFADEHGNWGGGLFKKCWLCGEQVQFLNGISIIVVQQLRGVNCIGARREPKCVCVCVSVFEPETECEECGELNLRPVFTLTQVSCCRYFPPAPDLCCVGRCCGKKTN